MGLYASILEARARLQGAWRGGCGVSAGRVCRCAAAACTNPPPIPAAVGQRRHCLSECCHHRAPSQRSAYQKWEEGRHKSCPVTESTRTDLGCFYRLQEGVDDDLHTKMRLSAIEIASRVGLQRVTQKEAKKQLLRPLIDLNCYFSFTFVTKRRQ
jgi:hypothetical protein